MRPQAAGMSCYSVAEEINPVCADFVVVHAVLTNRSARRQIPVDREKNREFFVFRAFRPKFIAKIGHTSAICGRIPYASESGIYFCEQGIRIDGIWEFAYWRAAGAPR
jgi:hypothetical protein